MDVLVPGAVVEEAVSPGGEGGKDGERGKEEERERGREGMRKRGTRRRKSEDEEKRRVSGPVEVEVFYQEGANANANDVAPCDEKNGREEG